MKSPIIIIGAGRSGTKILRDMLCTNSKLVTWPCDEINPIWRHGHTNYPTDELKPKHATDKIKRFIRNKFSKIRKKYNGERVVEKTCANTLRVAYVHKIFPNAKFIHIIRDGRDVAESVRRRWTGEVKLKYILKKARWVPMSDIPHYLFQFIYNRIQKLFSNENKLKTWGPRFDGIDKLVKNKKIIEVCGIQWKKSVKSALKDFKDISPSQVYKIKYEELVKNPEKRFRDIFKFLNIEPESKSLSIIKKTITDKNIGKGKKRLSKEDIKLLMPHIKDLLKNLNYL